MKKATRRNGIIYTYDFVPSEFQGSQKYYAVGFDNLTVEEQKAEGLYDLFTPEYNKNTQVTGPVVWNASLARFEYTIQDRQFGLDLHTMKQAKIQSLKDNLNRKLAATDWAYIRRLDRGTAIPSDIQSERNALRVLADAKEVEIQNLEQQSEVADYDITL